MFRYLIPLCILCLLAVSILWLSGSAARLRQHYLERNDPAPPDDYPETGGTWIEALTSSPVSLDPAYISSFEERRVAALLYSGLLRYDSRGYVSGDLAHTWSISRDARQYTFHLRRNVYFSNGRPLTADDVAFSFRRLLSSETESPSSWILQDILGAREYAAGKSNDVAGITTEDDYTIVITLEHPRAAFLYLLCTPAAYILDRRTTESYESPPPAAAEGGFTGFFPVGTGPFRLQSPRDAEQLHLVRNEDYHGPGPHLDAVKIRTGTDPEEAWELFGAGQLTVARLGESRPRPPSSKLLTGSAGTVSFLALDHQDDVTGDRRVREALSSGIDTASTLESVLVQGHIPAGGFIPPSVPGYSPVIECKYDPEVAESKLNEAGYPDGMDLTLQRSDSDCAQQLTAAIADDLADISIDVNFVTTPAAELPPDIGAKEADAQILHTELVGYFPDPEGFLHPLLHSSLGGTVGSLSGFSCSRMNALLDAGSRVTGEAERFIRLWEVEQLAVSELVAIPLYFARTRLAVQPFVRDYHPAILPEGDKLEKVWFDRKR